MITSEDRQAIRAWFDAHLPADLFESLAEVAVDREEIVVIGSLAAPEFADSIPQGERDAANRARVQEFRERTREARMAVARAAQHEFGRTVSWGVQCGETRTMFTHVAAPVMTRLRQPERLLLDTLIAGGVARSRSEALAWCVRVVQQHSGEWLSELRQSLDHVHHVRAQGPDATASWDSRLTPPGGESADEPTPGAASE